MSGGGTVPKLPRLLSARQARKTYPRFRRCYKGGVENGTRNSRKPGIRYTPPFGTSSDFTISTASLNDIFFGKCFDQGGSHFATFMEWFECLNLSTSICCNILYVYILIFYFVHRDPKQYRIMFLVRAHRRSPIKSLHEDPKSYVYILYFNIRYCVLSYT